MGYPHGDEGLVFDEHGAHYDEEFAHDGSEGDHFGFAFFEEVLVDFAELVGAADGDHGAEVEALAYAGVALFA